MEKRDFPPSPWPGKRFVGGEGPKGAKILILGEAPGEVENETGKPFSNARGAGRFLDTCLRYAKIDRSDCYITNVIKYQPPGNDIKRADSQRYIQQSLPHLYKEIKSQSPVVIVPVGNVALQALGIPHAISRARGSIIPTSFGKVIPTFHPAYYSRQIHMLEVGKRDWVKIARHTKTYNFPQFLENFNINPSVSDVELFARSVTITTQKQPVKLGIDIETPYIVYSPLDLPIKTISLASSENTALVIPFIDQSGRQCFNDGDMARIFLALSEILENPRVIKMFHNALFDVTVIKNHGIPVKEPIFDSMIGHFLIYEPAPHSLEHLVSWYSDYEPWKLEAGRSDKEFREYNARDTVVLHMIHGPLTEDIKANGQEIPFNILTKNIMPTVDMMLRGLPISKDQYNQVKLMLEAELEMTKSQLQDMAEDPNFNPDSPNQVRDFLFKKLKMRSQVRGKGGKLSTSEDVLKRLQIRYAGKSPEEDIVTALLKFRKLGQQYKMFIKNLWFGMDGRIHSSFKMTSTKTVRFASDNPNVMNLPKRADSEGYIRKMYRTTDDRILVAADWSQLELMIFAEIAEDEIWQKAFREGKDVHILNGEMLIGPTYDNSDAIRTFIKNFIYGLIYGSEGSEVEKLIPSHLIGKISVQNVMQRLLKVHPAVFRYFNRIETEVERRHYVVNAYGVKRWFFGKPSKADIRSAINHPIQSTAALIMHEKMPRIAELTQGYGTSILPTVSKDGLILQLHDEYVLEIDKNKLDPVARGLKEIMEETVYTPLGYEFNLKAEVRFGPSLSSKESTQWQLITES